MVAAVAAIFDGARGHDRGHGAAIRGKQRYEGFAVQADALHGAVRHHRGAREIPGILQNRDEEKQYKDLRQKNEDGRETPPNTVEKHGLQETRAQPGEQRAAKSIENVLQAVAQRLAKRKHDLKQGYQHQKKNERAPKPVQQHAVKTPRPDCRLGRTVVRRVREILRPPLASRGRLQDGQGAVSVRGIARPEKPVNGVDAGSGRAGDQSHGNAELAGEFHEVDAAAALLEEVRHVEDQQRRQAGAKDVWDDRKLAVEVRGVHDDQDGVGARDSRHFSVQNLGGDALVFGIGREVVNSRQINQGDFWAGIRGNHPGAVLDGDAWIVRDFLAKRGEPIEEG